MNKKILFSALAVSPLAVAPIALSAKCNNDKKPEVLTDDQVLESEAKKAALSYKGILDSQRKDHYAFEANWLKSASIKNLDANKVEAKVTKLEANVAEGKITATYELNIKGKADKKVTKTIVAEGFKKPVSSVKATLEVKEEEVSDDKLHGFTLNKDLKLSKETVVDLLEDKTKLADLIDDTFYKFDFKALTLQGKKDSNGKRPDLLHIENLNGLQLCSPTDPIYNEYPSARVTVTKVADKIKITFRVAKYNKAKNIKEISKEVYTLTIATK